MVKLSISIPDELMDEAEAFARARGTTKSEVVREALRRRLTIERLRELRRYGQQQAEELRIGPDDIETLVADVRRR